MICAGGKDESGRCYFIGLYESEKVALASADKDFDPYGQFKDSNSELGPLVEVTTFPIEEEFGRKVQNINPYSGSVVDASCGNLFMSVCKQFATAYSTTTKVQQN